jgi:hypothetical protein
MKEYLMAYYLCILILFEQQERVNIRMVCTHYVSPCIHISQILQWGRFDTPIHEVVAIVCAYCETVFGFVIVCYSFVYIQ